MSVSNTVSPRLQATGRRGSRLCPLQGQGRHRPLNQGFSTAVIWLPGDTRQCLKTLWVEAWDAAESPPARRTTACAKSYLAPHANSVQAGTLHTFVSAVSALQLLGKWERPKERTGWRVRMWGVGTGSTMLVGM